MEKKKRRYSYILIKKVLDPLFENHVNRVITPSRTIIKEEINQIYVQLPDNKEESQMFVLTEDFKKPFEVKWEPIHSITKTECFVDYIDYVPTYLRKTNKKRKIDLTCEEKMPEPSNSEDDDDIKIKYHTFESYITDYLKKNK